MVRCSEHRRKSDRKEIKVKSGGLEVNVEKHIRYRLVFFVFQQSGISFSFIVLYIEQRHGYYSFLIRYKLYGSKRRDGTEDKVNTHPIVPQQSRTQPSRTSKHKTHTSSKQKEKKLPKRSCTHSAFEKHGTRPLFIYSIYLSSCCCCCMLSSLQNYSQNVRDSFQSARLFSVYSFVRSFLVSNFVTLFFFRLPRSNEKDCTCCTCVEMQGY